ncbi:SCP2 sterol-binding domain-containing protein [Lysobacter sp. GX 14042]|uniref:ubiquinone biosynthesis accessory factor UbiJ n=1 Tax=Lysobacter sp. GX 14042 TaxID=2907155 RepID=UPI001F33174B|nr:SCP2 sterol-binding domain-containing protein [Lysobacter sp. GX 14042]MCE7032248.1 SCP2 sterol-binding domain-containing protein [Lysobacter sp. GX 14042]
MADTRPSPLGMLKPIAGRALELALNRALALDPDTRASLKGLDGRAVALHLARPPLALQVSVDGERLRVGPPADAPADLSVRGTLAGLLGQLPMLRRDDAAPVGELRIEGDAELARRLRKLADRFDPDWDLPFTEVFGDVLGVQVANGVRAALRQARETGAALAASTAEFLTEESRDVVARAELEAFNDDVDVLHDDVGRLAARISRLHPGSRR